MDWMGLEERIWTGCGLDPKGQCVRARFRGTLSMEQVPSRATISLASLNRYRLVVNGEIVMHGPARAPQREAYMDSMDITDCLHPGTNILEVDVEAYPAWPRKDLPGGCAGPMMHYPSPAGPMLSVTSRTFPEMESCAFWSVIPDLTVELNGRDGLLAGPTETVRMDRSRQEAFDGVKTIMEDKKFGDAGNTLVIEEFMTGREVSVLAYCDGTHIKTMTSERTLLSADIKASTIQHQESVANTLQEENRQNRLMIESGVGRIIEVSSRNLGEV